MFKAFLCLRWEEVPKSHPHFIHLWAAKQLPAPIYGLCICQLRILLLVKKPWKWEKHLSYHISWLIIKTGALFDWVMLWIYVTAYAPLNTRCSYFSSIYIGDSACFLIDAVLMSVIAFFPRRRRIKKQKLCPFQFFKIIIMAFQIIFNTIVITCINNVCKVKSC